MGTLLGLRLIVPVRGTLYSKCWKLEVLAPEKFQTTQFSYRKTSLPKSPVGKLLM